MKLQLLILIVLFSACNSIKKSKDFTDEHDSKNSLDWSGTYEGTLPCADCSGMETQLILNQDQTYSLSTKYQGKSEEVFNRKGVFQWNGEGNAIKLKMDGKPSLDHQYLFIEKGLLKLDRKGNKMDGNLKDQYKLTKNTSGSYNLKSNEHIYWINSLKVECTGVGKMMCMQVQKSDEFTDDNWQLFYDEIKGFDFEEGYIYKLIVKETERPKSEVPADASSVVYELVEVLEKNIDTHLKLHDIWALVSIKGDEINPEDFNKHPQLEINLTEKRVMGNDGCNNLIGEIKQVNSHQLEFNKLAGTKMACQNMQLADKISNPLNQVQTYHLNKLELTLFNSDGTELLRYKKVD